jgi:hypothetical protein
MVLLANYVYVGQKREGIKVTISLCFCKLLLTFYRKVIGKRELAAPTPINSKLDLNSNQK